MADGAKLPQGVERVLGRARNEPEFRRALVERKSAAALDAGMALTGSERAVLDAMDAAQLEAILDSMPARTVPAPPQTSFPPAGIRPVPPPAPEPMGPPKGFPNAGMCPVVPPSPEPSPVGPRWPLGVERVLRRAAAEPEFRRALLEKRSAAALDDGMPLTASERAVLDAMDATQVQAVAEALPPPRAGQPLPEVAALTAGIRPEAVKGIRPIWPIAVAVGVVGTAVCAGTVTHGVRPDVPPPRIEIPAPDAGPAADAGSEADRADPEIE